MTVSFWECPEEFKECPKGLNFGSRFISESSLVVAQKIKHLPAVRETQGRSLGQEDPLEKGMATNSNILAWRIPMDRGAWWATVQGVSKPYPQGWIQFSSVQLLSRVRLCATP